MNKLISLARNVLLYTNSQHISFLVKNKKCNQIICFGINNKRKTDPLANKYGYRFSCVHSEVACIKLFPYPPSKLSQHIMINIRIMADGSIGMSKPCKICQKLLKDFGIQKVYYTNRSGKFELLN